MEASLLDKPIFPGKQIKNPKKKTQNNNHPNQQPRHQLGRAYSIILDQNFAPPGLEVRHGHGGVFLNPQPRPPPPYALYSSSSLPPNYHLRPPHQQPPLLPLPVVTKPAFLSLPPPNRGHHQLSLSPPVTNINKKQNNKKKVIKKSTTNQHLKRTSSTAKSATTTTTTTKAAKGGVIISPDPGNLPKDVTRILLADMNMNSVNVIGNQVANHEEKLSGSAVIFSLSPPPSSLPLPKFSLRQQPRLSCTVEAAVGEIDDGAATDNLCRLLRLR